MPDPDRLPKLKSSYVIDIENVAEMARLVKQARMLSEYLGLLPATLDLTGKQEILDVGCGPGEWVLEMAQRYPASQVTGVDISERMIAYAQYYAQAHGISNAQFQSMDALQPMDFPTASFDFVHTRFISGFLSVTTWPQLVEACFQLLRPGGAFCSTEFESLGTTTSAALTEYNRLTMQASCRAGQCFTPAGDRYGTTAVQHHLLQQAGFQQIQQQAHMINYSAGMPAHEAMYDNLSSFLKLMQPFLIHHGVTKRPEIDALYTQTMEEMEDGNFCAVTLFQRVWGQKAR